MQAQNQTALHCNPVNEKELGHFRICVLLVREKEREETHRIEQNVRGFEITIYDGLLGPMKVL